MFSNAYMYQSNNVHTKKKKHLNHLDPWAEPTTNLHSLTHTHTHTHTHMQVIIWKETSSGWVKLYEFGEHKSSGKTFMYSLYTL